MRMLLDTNVVSELVKPRPHPKVVAFVEAQNDPVLSVLTIHELVFGAERTPDPRRRLKLHAWIAALRARFDERIVDISSGIAEESGRLRALAAAQGRAVDPLDALIGASALAVGASVATRNVKDFAPLGVAVVDPWHGP